ncbi:MFS transporter [Brevibacterium sp. UMB10442]|nr:MFS transporter [Brevibacterium sp. UMB10442]
MSTHTSAPEGASGTPEADGTETAAATTASGRVRRFALIGALYSSQNLSLGFFTYAFLTIAQARGVPLAAIGTAAGIATLLTLKFLWAPVVDRFGSAKMGHYRGWLIATQTLLGLGIASLALFDPAGDFPLLLGIFAVLFVLAATQDIAADATATRLLQPQERGFGNGLQSAGASVAQVVGGGLILLVYHAAGWQVATLSLALFSVLPLPLILGWREDASTATQPAPHVTLRSALAFFSLPAVRVWCFVTIPAYTLGFTVAYNLVRPLLVDAGWTEGRIGLYVVIGGSGVGIVAGLAAGALMTRLGRRSALIRLGALQVIATLAVVPMALDMTQPWLVLIVVAVANAAFSAAFAVVYTISMDLTRPQSAGTDFTFFTTVASIVMVIAGGGGMAAAGMFGYLPVLAVAGVLAVVGLVIAARTVGPLLRTEQNRTRGSASSASDSDDRASIRSQADPRP